MPWVYNMIGLCTRGDNTMHISLRVSNVQHVRRSCNSSHIMAWWTKQGHLVISVHHGSDNWVSKQSCRVRFTYISMIISTKDSFEINFNIEMLFLLCIDIEGSCSTFVHSASIRSILMYCKIIMYIPISSII